MNTLNKIDPIYQIIKRIICFRFFNAKGLPNFALEFLNGNVGKHRFIIWLNIIATMFIYIGLNTTPTEQIPIIIGALLAPAMVTGGAWFAVSFGGIPEYLLKSAVDITFWMFLSFTLSMRTMITATMFITPYILWPILIIIELGVLIACIMYDNADGLKIGLDDTLLKHSRAAIQYYKDIKIKSDDMT